MFRFLKATTLSVLFAITITSSLGFVVSLGVAILSSLVPLVSCSSAVIPSSVILATPKAKSDAASERTKTA